MCECREESTWVRNHEVTLVSNVIYLRGNENDVWIARYHHAQCLSLSPHGMKVADGHARSELIGSWTCADKMAFDHRSLVSFAVA